MHPQQLPRVRARAGAVPLLAALGLLLFFNRPAHADPVAFSTSGGFSVDSMLSSDSTANSAQTLKSADGKLQLDFAQTSSSGDTSNLLDQPFPLGNFTLSWTAGGGGFALAGDSFTMTITQSTPGVGTGSSSATVTGTLTQTGRNENATVTLSFGTDPILITTPGALTSYALDFNPLTFGGVNLTQNGSIQTSLNAYVTVVPAPVPLPAAAWGGLALFGVLGGGYKLRRKHWFTSPL
jgi:hypothetical protein